MEDSIESLEQSLLQYASQLRQIDEAIATDNVCSGELLSLRSSVTELIALTEESLESMKSQSISTDDPLSGEYELFKAELQDVLSAGSSLEETDDNIEGELDNLVGSKCRAPFVEQWASTSTTAYHNAMIMSVNSDDALDNIRVKVIFVNPTCREMVPCQYYLDGKCKFADDECHFSHGYVVYFSDLKEYKEPDFSLLKEDVTVLAKDEDDLWKRATVTAVLPESNQCSVRFELGRKADVVVDTHHTLPLDVEEGETRVSHLVSECSETVPPEADDEEACCSRSSEVGTEMTAEDRPHIKLGEWEKYTTGIGSKLMANMGYVIGSGLGKHGHGRVEPVDAVVLPTGKSLDHCMALREKAGGDPNLFNANQRLAKRRLRHGPPKNHSTTKVIPKKSADVFTFINDSLSGRLGEKRAESQSCRPALLKSSTCQALNVEELKMNESMNKKNYELMVLKEKLSRQKQNTVGHSALQKQIRGVEGQLLAIRTNLRDLHREKNYRKTMKDLTEF